MCKGKSVNKLGSEYLCYPVSKKDEEKKKKTGYHRGMGTLMVNTTHWEVSGLRSVKND